MMKMLSVVEKDYHKKMKAILSQMLHFQKINNITSQCVTNSKFLYDFFRLKFNIKLNIVVGFVVNEKEVKNDNSCGFTLCTHVWVEYDNVHYEPSLEWTNSIYRYTTIGDLLNSSIWKDAMMVSDNEKRDGIKKLLIDWEMHSKQVNILQLGLKGNKKNWEPVGFSAGDIFGGEVYYDNLLDFICPL